MNKFDAILCDICEANGYPNQQPVNNGTNQQQNNQQATNNNGQTNNSNNNNQQNTATNQQQTNNNQQQKIDFQKLMADFNSNTINIKNPKEFEKYGLKIS